MLRSCEVETLLLIKAEVFALRNLLYREELDVDVSHGGVDDGAVRHSLGALGLRGGHHLLLRRLLVKDVSVRVRALRILRFPL